MIECFAISKKNDWYRNIWENFIYYTSHPRCFFWHFNSTIASAASVLPRIPFILCECQAMVLMLFSNASNHPPWEPPDVIFANEARVRKLAYVAYVRTPTFISVRMILDMCTLILTPIFTQQFVFTQQVFKIFLVLILLYI